MARTKQRVGKSPQKNTAGKTPTQNKKRKKQQQEEEGEHVEVKTKKTSPSKSKSNKRVRSQASPSSSKKGGRKEEKKDGEEVEEKKEDGDETKKKPKRHFTVAVNRTRRLERAAKNADKTHFPRAAIRKFIMNTINSDPNKTVQCKSVAKDAVVAIRDIMEGIVFQDHLLPCAKNIRLRGRMIFDPATESICREDMSRRHPELNIPWSIEEFSELRNKRRRGFALPPSEEKLKKNARARAYKRMKAKEKEIEEENTSSRGRSRSRSKTSGSRKKGGKAK
jgi:hypothetical protein